MAKLLFDFCTVAVDIRSAIDERRIGDAKQLAAEHLRSGYHSQPFLNIVAELLKVKKQMGVRGPKHKSAPSFWYEIGNDFQELRDAGESYSDACEKLAKKYGSGVRTIEKAVAFFRKASKEHDDMVWERPKTRK
jgi:hypothetical protein